MSSKSEEHYHEKGQEDAKEGDYNEPHGAVESLFTWGSSKMEKDRKENEAYKEGYYNTKAQKDGAENSYDPPSDPDLKKKYDKAWNKSYEENN